MRIDSSSSVRMESMVSFQNKGEPLASSETFPNSRRALTEELVPFSIEISMKMKGKSPLSRSDDQQDLEDLIAPKIASLVGSSPLEVSKIYVSERSFGRASECLSSEGSSPSLATLNSEKTSGIESQVGGFGLGWGRERGRARTKFFPVFEDEFIEEFRFWPGELGEFVEFIRSSGQNTEEKIGIFDSWGVEADERAEFVNFNLPVVFDPKARLVKNRYKLLKKIGEGTFSDVFEAEDTRAEEGPKLLCVKRVKTSSEFNADDLFSQTITEISILKMISKEGGEGCVKLLDSFMFNQILFLVFERLNFDLAYFLRTTSSLNLEAITKVAGDIMRCLAFLHSRNLIHGDLKPENIGLTLSPLQAKLIDFGSAIFIGEQKGQTIQSLSYRAPEVSLRQTFDTRADIWSFGALLWFLLTRKSLFSYQNEHRCLAKALSLVRLRPTSSDLTYFLPPQTKNTDPFLARTLHRLDPSGQLIVTLPKLVPNVAQLFLEQGASPALADLAAKTLSFNPADRPSAAQIFLHPFFRFQTT